MAGCKVIGIYGGAGSGKSEVTRILKKKYKAYIIKADDIGHSLYRKNQPGYKALIRILGKTILDNNKEIDRKKLGEYLFKNHDALLSVNKAIHPMVYFKTRRLIDVYKKKHPHGIIAFEAALLPDRSLDFIDTNWYVHSDKASRAVRMKETRGYTDERINSLYQTQPSEDTYRNYCDYEIDNNGTLEELEEKTDEAIKYCQRQQR